MREAPVPPEGAIQARSGSMEKISFVLNGTATTVDVEPRTPLLWVLRDHPPDGDEIRMRHGGVRLLNGDFNGDAVCSCHPGDSASCEVTTVETCRRTPSCRPARLARGTGPQLGTASRDSSCRRRACWP